MGCKLGDKSGYEVEYKMGNNLGYKVGHKQRYKPVHNSGYRAVSKWCTKRCTFKRF